MQRTARSVAASSAAEYEFEVQLKRRCPRARISPAAWAAREATMTNHRAWTHLFLTTALAGGMLFAVGSTARADRDYGPDCARRLEADRARIDRDAAHFGEQSHQVDRDVARMDTDRQWCRDH